jgi:hypothetical protein
LSCTQFCARLHPGAVSLQRKFWTRLCLKFGACLMTESLTTGTPTRLFGSRVQTMRSRS